MYVVERAKKIKEQLKLVHDEKTKVVEINLSVTKRLESFNKNYRNVEMCLIEAQQGKNDFDKYGKAVIGLFNIVFGEKETQEIIEFYDCDYSEMLIDIFPFINNVITPAFIKERNRRMKQIKNKQIKQNK